jgi:uncharacterized membrane protein (UPF0127 family)
MKKTALVLLLLVLSTNSYCSRKTDRTTLSVNGRPLSVEIARTNSQRKRGLMHREELPWNEGMLFIFEDEKYLSFWMKNTSIPLSITFLDKNGRVVGIFDMEPFSLRPVHSTKKSQYAIEANRGFFGECGLKIGDRIDMMNF